MRYLHILIAAVLLLIFLRPDVQLVDLIVNTNILLASGCALLLFGVLIGQITSGHKPAYNTGKMAFWGVVVAVLLGMVEFTTEWTRKIALADNQTVVLSAASVETASVHITSTDEGLFRTKAEINGQDIDVLLDTGASLVLLNYLTADEIGLDPENLTFSVPVVTASGTMNIAEVTLPSVTVGNIVIPDVAAAVSPAGQIHSNLLGGSFLSRLDTAEFRGDRVILKQKKK